MLMEDFLNIHELGLEPAHLQDAARLQLLKEAVMPAVDKLTVARLGALISTMRRWKTMPFDWGSTCETRHLCS